MEHYTFLARIGVFSFSHRESIDLEKGSLRNKMYLNSIFNFFRVCVLEDFDRS